MPSTVKNPADTPRPTVNLRAEFKPLLSTINISVELSRSLASVPSRLTVEPGKIRIQSEILNSEFLLEGVLLKPATCRGLRWITPFELQLTLEADLPLQSGAGDADSCVGTQQFCQNQLVTRIAACQSRCYCMGCGAHILAPACKFKRILPLPSENWADFADIWFCHNHQSDGCSSNVNGHTNNHKISEVKKQGLIPRPEDCLVSSLYMLVRSRHIKACSVSHVMGKLICKRCGNFLGFVKSVDSSLGPVDDIMNFSTRDDVYKIYFHAVCFREECEQAPLFKNALHQGMKSSSVARNTNEQPIEEFMCHLLKDQSHRFTSFRFIIDSSVQYDEQAGVIILLWLLDQNLTVFQFSSLTPTINTLKSATDQSGQPSKLMKLLYKVKFHPHAQDHQESPPDVFKMWERDNTVHGISLPYPLCKQLVSLLIDSTKKLSVSQRNLNGFHVGYLSSS